MRRIMLVTIAVAVAFVASGCGTGQDAPSRHRHELEQRLLAPCCWRQSLADHDSPTATALRTEIDARIARGEPAASIEDDLVNRYGEKIRALPEGGDPRWIVGATAASVAVLSLVALGWFVRRRRGATVTAAAVPTAALYEGEYAERLDDELLEID